MLKWELDYFYHKNTTLNAYVNAIQQHVNESVEDLDSIYTLLLRMIMNKD